MLIRRIILENFGLYGGHHEFDLLPRQKYNRIRPIILFGGKNGAGKTTLLEAVRLALYGRTALGTRVRQVDYDVYLRGRIHRSRGDLLPSVHATVSVEFDYVRMGEIKTYRAERSWKPRGGQGVEESFVLLEDGAPVRDVDRDLAESFAREIVPEGLSQLFFFDGEKIRELAEDATGDETLADSIKALLGLDTVERLSADLSIYATRKSSEVADDDDISRLGRIDQELVDLAHKDEELTEAMSSLQTRLDGIQSEIHNAEDELRREGHVFSKQRDDLKAREAVLRSEIERQETEIRGHCERVFPFALCPSIAGRLRIQIEQETEQQRRQYLSTELQTAADDLLSRITEIKQTSACRTKSAAQVVDILIEATRNYFDARLSSDPDGGKPYLHLSPTDAAASVEILDQAVTISAPEVAQLCRGLEHNFRELETVRRDLERIPSDDVTGPIVQRIQQLHERLGAWREKLKQEEDERDAVRLKLQDAERRKRRLEESMSKRDTVSRKLEQVTRVRAALDDYLKELTIRKIDDLRRSVVECFNRLARKGDVIQNIEINPHTFAVTLYDQTGTAIPKSELSSGEKQIYAIAMLWGLARTSGRPLPMIIDTPLARLDSDHRRNLCRNYFPHASHQVVVLSTDTEVDQGLIKELSPNVSHSFHLEFDPRQGRTTASEGYFWRETEAAHV